MLGFNPSFSSSEEDIDFEERDFDCRSTTEYSSVADDFEDSDAYSVHSDSGKPQTLFILLLFLKGPNEKIYVCFFLYNVLVLKRVLCCSAAVRLG